jgi:hypothetical protein
MFSLVGGGHGLLDTSPRKRPGRDVAPFMQYSLPLESAQRETAVHRSELINLDSAKPLIEKTFSRYSLARDNINRSSNKQAAWPALTTLAADAAK